VSGETRNQIRFRFIHPVVSVFKTYFFFWYLYCCD